MRLDRTHTSPQHEDIGHTGGLPLSCWNYPPTTQVAGRKVRTQKGTRPIMMSRCLAWAGTGRLLVRASATIKLVRRGHQISEKRHETRCSMVHILIHAQEWHTLVCSWRGLMSTECGKTHLAPPASSNPETRADWENAKFCLKKKAKKLITLKRFPIRFPKFP
jgi:hypothetical protein